MYMIAEPINLICLIIFNIELILKLLAFRSKYWGDWWNKFDAFCVISSDAGIVAKILFPQFSVGPVTSAIRMLRIVRLFRLIRFLQDLNQLCNAFWLSIPKLTNVGAVLLLCLLIFGLLGLNLFSDRFMVPDSTEGNTF